MLLFKLKAMKPGGTLMKIEKDFLFETFLKMDFFKHLRENEKKEN